MEVISRVCIDTCAYSAFKRNNALVKDILETSEIIYVPVVVLGELYAGFMIGKYEERNLDELSEFLDMPGVFIIETNIGVSRRYGKIVYDLKKHGTPIPTNDIWIAAACFESASYLLTSDKHFQSVPGLITRVF